MIAPTSIPITSGSSLKYGVWVCKYQEKTSQLNTIVKNWFRQKMKNDLQANKEQTKRESSQTFSQNIYIKEQ